MNQDLKTAIELIENLKIMAISKCECHFEQEHTRMTKRSRNLFCNICKDINLSLL